MIEKAPWIKLKKGEEKKSEEKKNSFPQWSKSQENRFLQPIQDVQNSKKVLYDIILQQIDWIVYSVRNRPGPWKSLAVGLRRVPDEIGVHNADRPRPWTCSIAVIVKDDDPHDVRQFWVEDSRCLRRMAGMAGDDTMSSALVLRSYLSGKLRKRLDWMTQSRRPRSWRSTDALPRWEPWLPMACR